MKKLFLLVIFFSCCSANIVSSNTEDSAEGSDIDLSRCEIVEKQYIGFSNELFTASFDLNDFIDSISPENIDKDRETFFSDMDKNWRYQEVYRNYLQVRFEVYDNINKLYTKNTDCIVSGDQEISKDQVREAEKDLSDFITKYED
tara:strand:+ start:138 stop:572 length:435 start_codon:yes stop_codon:yes gene_type:complete